MSRVVGRGRYATETYPEAGRGGGGGGIDISTSFVDVSSPISTDDTAFQTLLSMDVLSTGNDSFLIWASVCAASDQASEANFELTLDDNPINSVGWTTHFVDTGDPESGGTVVAVSAPAAGTRTFAIKWKVDGESGATVQVDPTNFQHATLLIQRLTAL